MNFSTYQFKLGTFECFIVNDGTLTLPNPAAVFFPTAPKELLTHHLRGYGLQPEQWDQYVTPYPSLVINTGQHWVLIDTGAGEFLPTTGNLIPNLLAVGIDPKQIDTVILTHGHADHIGGNLDGEGKPAFPNARYVMWKDEWDFWVGDPDLSSLQADESLIQVTLDFARKKLPPIQPQLDLIDEECEIVPGIRAIAAPGHSLGHMAVSVTSDNEQLLDVVDGFIHPIHIHQPDWFSAVDLAPDQTVTTRYRLLERAATENALVFAFHFPPPCLGHIIQKGEAWQWQPLESSQ